ncbi:F-actin-monooxygenase MICAL3-like isoform X2 [Artemia franciscana]
MTEIRGIQALEIWCRRLTSGYTGVNISNLTTSFRDGLAFCAIIHHYRPDLIDFDSLSKDNVYKNNALAFQVAEQELGIPALLDPEDMVRYPVPDRLSVSTYLAQFYHVFGGKSSKSSPSTPSKRPSPEKTSATPGSTKKIFSREFNMTQDRSASSLRLTDNCNTCKLPVFLAERLKIGSKLFHRICFKCARCAAQLTPGNQYETENGEHCCEVCPDEEGSLTSSITSLSPNISSLKISEILDSDASVDKIQEEKSKRIERFPSSVQSLISRFDTQAARSAFFTNELRSRFEEMPPNAKEEKEDEINSVSEKAFDSIKENEQPVSTNGIPESQPKLESTTDISIIHQRHSPCNPFEEEEGQPSSVSGLCSSNMEDDGAEPSVINSSAVEKEDVVSELEIDNKSDVDSLHSEDVDLSAQDMHNVDLPFVAEVGDDVQTGSADKTPIENSDESEVVAVLPVASPRKRGKSKTKLAEYPESLNPFDDGLESEDQHMKLDDKAEGTNQEKGSLTLNPFEEEDEDFDDTNPFAEDVISVRKSPVPLPRKSLESSRESSYPYMRSPSPSLSIGSSISMTPTLRKRLTPISPMTDTSRVSQLPFFPRPS